MDGNRFDDLTRSLATRRGILRGGLAAVAALAGAALGPSRAAAAPKRLVGQVCRKHGDCASGVCLPKDATGRQYCGCSDVAQCPAGTDCVPAVCTAQNRCATQALPEGSDCPTGICVAGACLGETGDACAAGPDCISGNCAQDVAPPNTSQLCCPDGVINCQGNCCASSTEVCSDTGCCGTIVCGGACCASASAVCDIDDNCCSTGVISSDGVCCTSGMTSNGPIYVCCASDTDIPCTSECCTGGAVCLSDPVNAPTAACCPAGTTKICADGCCPAGVTACNIDGDCDVAD